MNNSAPICCQPDAISASDKPRYQRLTNKLLQARSSTEELADGYSFRFEDQAISAVEVAEWVSYERRCCPFLTFGIEVKGDGGELILSLKGAPGTKQVLRAALGF